MPPRIPTEADFAPLANKLTLSLVWPSPRESTTAILLLFHGLGDSEAPFAGFARSLNLPGVLAIAVRGTAPVPAALLGEPVGAGTSAGHFHWGDDLALDPATGDLDADPGFGTAVRKITDLLVAETLVGKCGWEARDILLFGFGQGGSLALGLASQLRTGPAVVDVTDGAAGAAEPGRTLKGVVSIGGPLAASTVPTISSRGKSSTPVLLCQLFEDDEIDDVKAEFRDVRVVRWRRREVAMPRDREEALPLIQFFAERLRAGW